MYKELLKEMQREEPLLNEYVGPLNKTIGEVATQGHHGATVKIDVLSGDNVVVVDGRRGIGRPAVIKVEELDQLIALLDKVRSESFRQ